MKYCSGRCRRKHIKIEGIVNNCPYHKGYTIDKENDDSKVYELCIKKNFFITLFWKLFFPDLITYNNFSFNSRKSNSVSINRENVIKDREINYDDRLL
jgi:hypothetical protein